jgi:hypothetical protein
MKTDTDTIHKSTQDPLDDEERELMNPENWDWEHVSDVRIVGEPGAVLRVRFSREEFTDLARIARSVGMGPVAWLHQIALERIAAEEDRQG